MIPEPSIEELVDVVSFATFSLRRLLEILRIFANHQHPKSHLRKSNRFTLVVKTWELRGAASTGQARDDDSRALDRGARRRRFVSYLSKRRLLDSLGNFVDTPDPKRQLGTSNRPALVLDTADTASLRQSSRSRSQAPAQSSSDLTIRSCREELLIWLGDRDDNLRVLLCGYHGVRSVFAFV